MNWFVKYALRPKYGRMAPVFGARSFLGLFGFILLSISTGVLGVETSKVLRSNEWYQLSVPVGSSTQTVQSVFDPSELSIDDLGETWAVYTYNASTNEYDTLLAEDTLNPGVGFWVLHISNVEVTLNVDANENPTNDLVLDNGCPSVSGCIEVPLVTTPEAFKWNMIGYPFGVGQALTDLSMVTNSGPCMPGCSLDQSEQELVSHSSLWHWAPEIGQYRELGSGSSLHGWQGYFYPAYSDPSVLQPTLMVPLPGSSLLVPDLSGQDQLSAGSAILDAGFVEGVFQRIFSDVVPLDGVISQYPSSGILLEAGSPVDLVLSLGPDNPPIVVPNYVGLTLQDASEALVNDGFSEGVVNQQFNENVSLGEVFAQVPAAGLSAVPDSLINLVVSAGPMPTEFVVPDLISLTQSEAELRLSEDGIKLGDISFANNDSVDFGLVFEQVPVSGSVIGNNEAVSFIVSSGISPPPLPPISVPDFSGTAQASLEELLEQSSLSLGNVTYVNSGTVPEGQIISQSLASGTSVQAGSVVNVIVSAGDTGVKVHITDPVSLSTIRRSAIRISGDASPDEATLTINGIEVPHADGRFSTVIDLQEGHNKIVASIKQNDIVLTDALSVSVDLSPPRVTIDSHEDNQVVTGKTIQLTGLINDIVRGTIEQTQASVLVNGDPALISNRSYSATIELELGENIITVEGSDQVGNTATESITLLYKLPEAGSITVAGGQDQTGDINRYLSDALQVLVKNAADEPLVERDVIFRVVQGAGVVGPDLENSARALVVKTDSDGIASAQFSLGPRVGMNNHKVRASVVGIDDEVTFSASARGRNANKISVNSGNNQRGAVGQVLAEPLVVVATDHGANVVPNIRVNFEVTAGDGRFVNDEQTYVAVTDSDGRATAEYVLGSLEGLDAQRITATVADPENELSVYTGFSASAFVPINGGTTSVSGIVLDNQDDPLEGVTVRVESANRQAVSDEQGQFFINDVPIGPIHVIADGSTASGGEYPSLSYNMVTVAGINNPLVAPVYMVKLDTENAVYAGPSDVVLELDKYPGFKLEIAANSVTFPDGEREGFVSVTPVNASTVPMAPPNGMQPQFIVTIQPAGTLFNPPAKLTLPNVDGHEAGAQVEMYSFDHDLEEFVSIGLGAVSEDSTSISSNAGVGVVKAGWHCGSQPASQGCAHGCGLCQECDGDCNCVPSNDDSGLAELEVVGDCKSYSCSNGGPLLSNDDSDVPEDDAVGDCKTLECMLGKIVKVNDDSDISEDDAPCMNCSAGELVPREDDLACGDGTPEQSCFVCDGGRCGPPDSMPNEEFTLRLNSADAASVPGLKDLINSAEKAINVLPLPCDDFMIDVFGSYTYGTETCPDCLADEDTGTFYKLAAGAGVATECFIGPSIDIPRLDERIVVRGYGLKVEFEASVGGGIEVSPNIQGEVSGQYNPDCGEGCLSVTATIALPFFAGLKAEIVEAEAEVVYPRGEFELFEVDGAEIKVGFETDFSGSLGGSIGTDGCSGLNCSVSWLDGKALIDIDPGKVDLWGEFISVNLSRYISFSFEFGVWDGGTRSCS